MSSAMLKRALTKPNLDTPYTGLTDKGFDMLKNKFSGSSSMPPECAAFVQHGMQNAMARAQRVSILPITMLIVALIYLAVKPITLPCIGCDTRGYFYKCMKGTGSGTITCEAYTKGKSGIAAVKKELMSVGEYASQLTAFASHLPQFLFEFALSLKLEIKKLSAEIYARIQTVSAEAFKKISEITATVKRVALNTWNEVYDTVLKPVIGSLMQYVVEPVTALMNRLLKFVKMIIDSVGKVLDKSTSIIKSAYNGVYHAAGVLSDTIENVLKKSAAIIEDVVDGLRNGINTCVSDVVGVAEGAVKGMVTAVNATIGGIETGINETVHGLTGAVEDGVNSVGAGIKAAGDKMESGVNSSVNKIFTATEGVVNQLGSTVEGSVNVLGKGVADSLGSVIDETEDIINDMTSLLTTGVNGAISVINKGIADPIEAAVNSSAAIVEKALDGIMVPVRGIATGINKIADVRINLGPVYDGRPFNFLGHVDVPNGVSIGKVDIPNINGIDIGRVNLPNVNFVKPQGSLGATAGGASSSKRSQGGSARLKTIIATAEKNWKIASKEAQLQFAYSQKEIVLEDDEAECKVRCAPPPVGSSAKKAVGVEVYDHAGRTGTLNDYRFLGALNHSRANQGVSQARTKATQGTMNPFPVATPRQTLGAVFAEDYRTRRIVITSTNFIHLSEVDLLDAAGNSLLNSNTLDLPNCTMSSVFTTLPLPNDPIYGNNGTVTGNTWCVMNRKICQSGLDANGNVIPCESGGISGQNNGFYCGDPNYGNNGTASGYSWCGNTLPCKAGIDANGNLISCSGGGVVGGNNGFYCTGPAPADAYGISKLWDKNPSTFCHTGFEKYPSIVLTLKNVQPVATVVIKNRPDKFQQRLAAAKLQVFNDAGRVIRSKQLTGDATVLTGIGNTSSFKISLTGNILNLSEIDLVSSAGVSLLNSSAVDPIASKASSVWDTTLNYALANVWDKNPTTTFSSGSESTPNLLVVMKEPVFADTLVITNRKDCCQDRLAGAVVEVYDGLGNTITTQKLTSADVQTVQLVAPPPATTTTAAISEIMAAPLPVRKNGDINIRGVAINKVSLPPAPKIELKIPSLKVDLQSKIKDVKLKGRLDENVKFKRPLLKFDVDLENKIPPIPNVVDGIGKGFKELGKLLFEFFEPVWGAWASLFGYLTQTVSMVVHFFKTEVSWTNIEVIVSKVLSKGKQGIKELVSIIYKEVILPFVKVVLYIGGKLIETAKTFAHMCYDFFKDITHKLGVLGTQVFNKIRPLMRKVAVVTGGVVMYSFSSFLDKVPPFRWLPCTSTTKVYLFLMMIVVLTVGSQLDFFNTFVMSLLRTMLSPLMLADSFIDEYASTSQLNAPTSFVSKIANAFAL